LSPELIFSVFNEENGFVVQKIVLYKEMQKDATFYEVLPPTVAKQRVELMSWQPVVMAVVAKKIAVRPIFARTPQQSDYIAAWNTPVNKTAASLPWGAATWNTPNQRAEKTPLLGRMLAAVRPHLPYSLHRWEHRLSYIVNVGPRALYNTRTYRKLSQTEIMRERGGAGG
jgi:hypothetical protein